MDFNSGQASVLFTRGAVSVAELMEAAVPGGIHDTAALALPGVRHVLTAADRISDLDVEWGVGPGKHGVGQAMYLYVHDPGSDHRIELYSEFSRSGATYTPFPDPRSHRIRLVTIAHDHDRTVDPQTLTIRMPPLQREQIEEIRATGARKCTCSWITSRPPARWVITGRPSGPHYWLRVWATRGLLWAWDDIALETVGAALDDDAWRVREMAVKVVARHRLEDLLAGRPWRAPELRCERSDA
mgnify:CR=1 FL=1